MSRLIVRVWAAVALIAGASLAGPVAAGYATTPAGSQYSGDLGENAHGGSTGGAATLPFTGLDLAEVTGVGVALIAAGGLLRVRARDTGA